MQALLKEFLIEKGFLEYLITDTGRVDPSGEVMVYLKGCKLQFWISSYWVDCVLLSGGPSGGVSHFIKSILDFTDIRDPKSFDLIWERIEEYLPFQELDVT